MTEDTASPGTVLDPDITERLAAQLSAEPPDDAAADRIKRHLLRMIAEGESNRHLTVRAAQGRWHELGGGLALKVLHREGATMPYLVRMAPGSVLPPHRHPVDEELLI